MQTLKVAFYVEVALYSKSHEIEKIKCACERHVPFFFPRKNQILCLSMYIS